MMMSKVQPAQALATKATQPAAVPAKVAGQRLTRPSLRAVSRRPARCAPVRAKQDDGVVEFAKSIGLATDEGIFGFRPFAELWVGRLAMMGFVTSIAEEFATGRGTLQQIGITTPDNTLLLVLSGLAVTATLVGVGNTLNSARTGKMSRRDLARYRNFLGMKDEEGSIAATARAMKLQGDFTGPDNLAAIDAAKRSGTAADAFLAPTDGTAVAAAATSLKEGDSPLALDDVQQAAAAATALKEREQSPAPGPSVSLSAREDIIETGTFTASDWDYAREVEMTNGRWAMLGFLTAVLVEAGTGKGIIFQLIMWAKYAGLLGAESGF